MYWDYQMRLDNDFSNNTILKRLQVYLSAHARKFFYAYLCSVLSELYLTEKGFIRVHKKEGFNLLCLICT